jgi:serine phosphatase RsbU (regulator of sigma subunit)
VATLAKLCRNERALARALQELADKDAALTADLEAASRFQESLLCLQPCAAGFDLCVVYRPLHLVGGDVYDVAELAPGHVRIFVGDATGHGVQAAFRTILIKSEYDAIKGARCPVELMGELNRRIVAKYEHLGMSFTACCYDITRAPGARTAQVRYVNGAFPSSIHVAGGEAREIFGIGSMLGVRREVRFDVKDLQLGLGDALFVFTDGLFEARDGEKREYGYRRLRNALLAGRARGLHDAAEQVFTELESFIAPCSLTDDATLIGLAMTEGGAAERTHD